MYEIIELSEEQSEELNEALEEFDTEHITYRMEGSICLGIQESGELIAGVNACVTCFKILYIETLFVREGYRRKGLGKKLLTETERRAKEMGVNLIRVDTFDWQGKDFYLARGYELAGQYTCEEDGYSEYFFVKRVVPGGRG